MKKTQIFISYSSKDRKIVEKIHQSLSSLDNFIVWRDQTRLEKDWSREIAFALAESDVLCLMWSESAATSKWVKNEWLTARALEKRIIPFLFHDAPGLPEPLHNVHCVHLEESDPNVACQEVVNRLQESKTLQEPYDYKVLPANSYIPFNPNPEFVGRHLDLLDLYLKMIGNLNKIGINQVGTVGMGGVGKTQLAVEFAYRFSFAFNDVFWIQAAEVNQWKSKFVELARDRLELSISDPDQPQADKRYIFRLQKYLKYNPQTLIIMDNVIEPKLLNNESFLYGITPLTLGCNLLFTTRQHFCLNGVTDQAVDVLSPESAYMLLTHDRKPITPKEEEDARAICNAVGYLPLAIILAAGYLDKYTDVSFSAYRDKLIKNKLNMIDMAELCEEELATRHVAAVRITLEEDWKKINDDNSRLLFQLAGQFSEAEIIPKARLRLLAGIASEKKNSHRPLDKAINLLNSLSLAEKMKSDSRAIRLHPLVREFALKTVPETEQNNFRSNAAENLRSAYFDYSRLKEEINARGVAEVTDDLKIAIDWCEKRDRELQDLRLIHGALRLSFDQLTHDTSQLAPHLIGRLKDIRSPRIEKLLNDGFLRQKRPWFYPVRYSLIPPGGPLLQTFQGHSGGINVVAISPDGKTVLSGSRDNTLKLWDISTGQTLHTFEGHRDFVNAVTFLPDGKTAISGSDDNTLKLWDLSSGKALGCFVGHSDSVTKVVISPDGKTVLSGSRDNTLRLWDLLSGRALHTLDGHSGRIYAVSISPDSKTAISGSQDNTVKLWDLSNGKVLRNFEGHSSWVFSVAISPNGKTAISGSSDNTLKLWDLYSGKMLQSFEGHSATVTAIAISPDGKTALSSSDDRTLIHWDLSNGKALHTLEGHSGWVFVVAINPDGKTAVSGSSDKTLIHWDLSSGKALHIFRGHTGMVMAVAINPDGKTVVSGSDDNTLKLWDFSYDKSLHTYWRHGGRALAVAISPDGKAAVSGSSDNTLKLWDLSADQIPITIKGHNDWVHTVAISPDGRTIISGSSDKTIKLWDLSSGKALKTFEGHSGMVITVAISPDGQTALSGSDDRTLMLWDLSKGRTLQTFRGHSDTVTAVAISPDGKTAVSGSSDKTLKLWDLSSGKALNTFEGHSGAVTGVVISPDGSTTLSGSHDKTFKLWDLPSGKLLQTFKGHNDWVYAVAFSPNGKTALSGSDDKALKLWDLSSGKAIATFVGDSGISCLATSYDGKFVLAGEENGFIHFLKLEGLQ